MPCVLSQLKLSLGTAPSVMHGNSRNEIYQAHPFPSFVVGGGRLEFTAASSFREVQRSNSQLPPMVSRDSYVDGERGIPPPLKIRVISFHAFVFSNS